MEQSGNRSQKAQRRLRQPARDNLGNGCHEHDGQALLVGVAIIIGRSCWTRETGGGLTATAVLQVGFACSLNCQFTAPQTQP